MAINKNEVTLYVLRKKSPPRYVKRKKKAALHSVFSVLPFVCWEEGLGIFTNLWINYLWKEVREPINSSCF